MDDVSTRDLGLFEGYPTLFPGSYAILRKTMLKNGYRFTLISLPIYLTNCYLKVFQQTNHKSFRPYNEKIFS